MGGGVFQEPDGGVVSLGSPFCLLGGNGSKGNNHIGINNYGLI